MFYKFDSHPRPGYYDDEGRLVTAKQKTVGSVRTSSNKKDEKQTALGSEFGGMGGPGGSGGMMGSENISDLYNPVRDRLDEGSIIEDWIPRDQSGLNEMFRLMYHRDPIAGTIVDLLAELIWGDFQLTGVSDPSIKKVYEDCLDNLNIQEIMPMITREYLVLGRNISSLMYDSTTGLFSDIISHDPSVTKITPIPIRGYDPKIDILPTPGVRAFLQSNDIRDIEARSSLPQDFINSLMNSAGGGGYQGNISYPSSGYPSGSGGGFGIPSTGGQGSGAQMGIPLDPLTTLFTARRVFMGDSIGTSLYTRIINFWALEKALLNATMSSARRRTSPILHVKMGIDNVWEPTPGELENATSMFIQADQDPVGAVVTTRTGVEASEVRSGTDFYKWSDEWTLLTEGKMRALGANDALLAGDATYSNQETARMFFMERASSLRDTLTKDIITKKIFSLIARIHGFTKRSKAEMSHNIRVKRTQRDAMNMQDSDLIIPTINHAKELVNNVDESKLDVYDILESKGVPITLQNWAQAGGVNLEDQISDMDFDADLRKRVNEYRSSFDLDIDVEEAKAKANFVRELQKLSQAQCRAHFKTAEENKLGPLNSYLFWDESGHFGPVKMEEMSKFIGTFDPNDNSVMSLADSSALHNKVISNFRDPKKSSFAHYLIWRTGLTRIAPALTDGDKQELQEAVDRGCDKLLRSKGSRLRVINEVQKEIKAIQSCSASHRKEALNKIDQQANRIFKSPDKLSGVKLYSGNGRT